jgi:hypothetical protein
MRMMTVHGFAALALGAALAIGFGTQAQAAAPGNYSRACTEVVASVVASNGFVEKALYASCGVPHRSPDSPSPWLLNREDDGRRAVTKRVSSVSSGCRREPAVTPESIQARLHR